LGSSLSDDSDAYDLEGDAEVGLEHDDFRVDEGVGLQLEDVVDQEVGVEAAVGEAEKGEGKGKDEGYSDIFHSDELISPRASDEEGATEAESSRRPCVTKRVSFSKDDLKGPILQRGNTFQDVYEFRKAIKQASVLKVKDLTYQKNSKTKCIAVHVDKNCKYRVYGRQMKDESAFMLISIRHRHTCPRRYKNHLITLNLIAECCMDCFKDQTNMPIDVLKKNVKKKWNVEIHHSSLYRARKKAQQTIYRKLGDQYYRLWDYCAAIRSTNVRSCVILMVEIPMPEVPCRFQRKYMPLAVMKNGFRDGCRPIIGLDACFLKGVYKGKLMVAIGRDANENKYSIAIAVVEANTKYSWTWFLEALLVDLGPSGPYGWTFLSLVFPKGKYFHIVFFMIYMSCM
jgi:hypothetical protein